MMVVNALGADGCAKELAPKPRLYGFGGCYLRHPAKLPGRPGWNLPLFV
jgi:hypothetical protein